MYHRFIGVRHAQFLLVANQPSSDRQGLGVFQPEVKPDVNCLFWKERYLSRQNSVFILTINTAINGHLDVDFPLFWQENYLSQHAKFASCLFLTDSEISRIHH